MRARIAVVGAGITGMMVTRACADRGAQVDLYDADRIPNPHGLSYATGRLWRHIHPENPQLQALSCQSLSYWRFLIRERGSLAGVFAPTIRIATEEEASRLGECYRKAHESFSLGSYWLSAQRSLYQLRHKSDVMFIGNDGLLLNAKNICIHLASELGNMPGVRLLQNTKVNVNRDLTGTSVHTGKTKEDYDCVVLATGGPAEQQIAGAQKKYQVHLHLTSADCRVAALSPVLDMGDDRSSWAVPSPDRAGITVSASAFAFSEEPDAATLEECWGYLAAQVKFGYVRATKCLSVYHEILPASREVTPYWHRDNSNKIYMLTACDAGLFKAAPALAESLATDIFEKGNV